MDDNNYNVRIDDNFLRADFTDGQVLQHTDLNKFESVVKTAINANYEDIQKLQDGTVQIGSAETLNGASLSTYGDETLQNSDTKVPTSMQVKQYVDASLSAIDLSGYETKLEAAATVAIYDSTGNGIVDNAEKVNSHTVEKDVPSNAVFTDTVYDDTEVRGLIQTNANNITSINTNLTNNYVTNTSLASTLTGYVKPTDYASNSKGGTIKSSSDYATSVLGSGFLTANNYTFSQYQSRGNNMFISKGTLENVITGKELTNKTYVDTGLAAKQGTLTAGSNITISGNTISATDTTYSNATTETAGLMSAADKTKLDNQIKELIGTESAINLSTLAPGIYRIKGYVSYFMTQFQMNIEELLTELANFETFIVSDYYNATKDNSINLSIAASSSYYIDDVKEKSVFWVEKNTVLILQKTMIDTTRARYHRIRAVDLTNSLNSPVLVWQNSNMTVPFASQTITITQDFVRFMTNALNTDSFDNILSKLFIEIVYTYNCGVSSNPAYNVPTLIKSTGRLPICSLLGTTYDTSFKTIVPTSLSIHDIFLNPNDPTENALIDCFRKCSITYDNNELSIIFDDNYLYINNNIDPNPDSSVINNSYCIPLCVYISLDSNTYKDLTVVNNN